MTQTVPIHPAAPTTNRYRVADIQVLPAGDKLVLVHCQDTQNTTLLRSEIANFLMQCQEFRTLDEHIAINCQGRELSSRTIEVLRRQLQHLTQGGFLLSQARVSGFFQENNESQGTIASLCFPTCDRVASLEQCIVSYIEHCQRFERNPEYIVADDSASLQTREAYRHMLKGLKTKYKVPIAYAGLEEKTAYADALSREGNIPAEIVSFLCLSNKQYRETTIGANRNVLLLHTIGDLIFSSDDDMRCRISPSPQYKKGLTLTSQGLPAPIYFYPDRERALQATPVSEQDLLALHEQWLGQKPMSCQALVKQKNALDYEQVMPVLLRRLATGEGNIALTVHGFVGDCSFDDPDMYLGYEGETLKQLIESESAFRSLHHSREIAYVAKSLTVTGTPVLPYGMSIGLDNRELLPPFLPLGRGEDVAFGNILSACFPNVFAAHLPWTILHAPLEKRTHHQKQHKLQIDFEYWVRFGMSEYSAGFALTPVERLRKMGQHLEDFGRLPTKSFESLLHEQIYRTISSLISQLEEGLCTNQTPLPDFWVQNVRDYIAQIREEALLPLEQLYAPNCNTATLQQLFQQFGQGLQWWPQIVGTARRLRARGVRLAQPL
ncbi:hypothetical protein KSC_061160 [Ktedonobacter sp. SOSP1-52]|uniref:hypothetical protein n=1 Tax=Ktedonobacter sp. SOSP1-52 TaxID=2778366 RepID=UPI0019157A26|nr:hypothetical protein [Ktedonobacter sp. SOSP1-52]GHO67224.1 hypothetical protein KSC_061160 [Ktedonobacter sp. SOSP1-52]